MGYMEEYKSWLTRFAADEGLGALAELSGIPGTLGGAVRMNAGASGQEIGALVHQLKGVTFSGGDWSAKGSDLEFSYRSSSIPADVIVTEIVLELKQSSAESEREKIKVETERRKSREPSVRSAGCTFRNVSVLEPAGKLIDEAVSGEGEYVTVTNTLSFDRNDPIFLECEEGYVADCECRQQTYKNLDGKNILIISGLVVPAFSTVKIKLIKGNADNNSEITVSANGVSTPFADIKFDKKGYIESLVDKRAGREIRGSGYPLNALITAEDLPSA